MDPLWNVWPCQSRVINMKYYQLKVHPLKRSSRRLCGNWFTWGIVKHFFIYDSKAQYVDHRERPRKWFWTQGIPRSSTAKSQNHPQKALRNNEREETLGERTDAISSSSKARSIRNIRIYHTPWIHITLLHIPLFYIFGLVSWATLTCVRIPMHTSMGPQRQHISIGYKYWWLVPLNKGGH